MPSQITSHQYGQAVLEHVQNGTYPEEEVISAELPSSALPEISKLVEQARDEVKTNIRKASKDSAPDIDGWISQAKQLRADIQRSQEIARDIVEQARQGERLEEQVNDAASKLDLLNGEVAFNKTLGAILERLQAAQRTLDVVQRSTLDGRLLEAVDLLGRADADLTSLSATKTTRVSGVLGAKVTDLRNHLREKLIACWKAYIDIDPSEFSVRIRQSVKGPPNIDLSSLVTALTKLNLFDDVLQPFCKDFESSIITPRLQVHPDGTVGSLKIEGEEICITSGRSSNLSAQALFADLGSVIDFLQIRLPPPVVEPLASFLMPRLIARLIATWLASAVPEDVDGMEDFEDTTSLVKQFGNRLDSLKWPGKRELVDWMNGISNVWLRKRQETSLNNVRQLLSKELGAIETVERVETQMLSHSDEVLTGGSGGDDWDAGWSDDETSPTVATDFNAQKLTRDEDEEDVSAWGLDEDQEGAVGLETQEQSGAADDDADAWGWGDEKEGEEITKPSKVAAPSTKKLKSSGRLDAPPQAERELTLKETYNITSLPKEILEIISQVISDAAKLETPEYASSPIASAATGLLSLPGLILAMYRASSSTSYSRHPSGPMFLYNDCLWLAERLQHLASDHTTMSGKRVQSRVAYNLNLPVHISSLENFGKRAYAKEMESQRTVITDLLDGAQGFLNCTEHPFTGECDLAIASTVDRLRALHRQWKDVLSHSALLQSLGSLLSSVTNKIIVDIEDMPDISEPESQQLTAYCNRIATLEDLFLPSPEARNPAQNSDHEPVPLTAVYTPHWLKFRYLANILESSLVDIKYLWTEGELGLEFDTEELVDLVVALFADSPHRRGAVAEIRGRRTVRQR